MPKRMLSHTSSHHHHVRRIWHLRRVWVAFSAALIAAAGGAWVGAQGSASPGPSPAPSPSASAAAAAEDLPEAYRRVLATLRDRKEEQLPEKELLFGRSSTPDWAQVRVREIKNTPRGLALVLDDDPKEHYPGAIVRGRRLVSLTVDEATFEHAGEQRRIKLKRAAPTLAVRAIKQVEGEWAAFLEGERRPLYPGDVVRGTRIVKVEPDGVIFQFGNEQRKIGPKAEKKPFPNLAFNGIIDMTGGRVVLLKGRSDTVKVGDVVENARIVDIAPTGIVVEYLGERRTFPAK